MASCLLPAKLTQFLFTIPFQSTTIYFVKIYSVVCDSALMVLGKKELNFL